MSVEPLISANRDFLISTNRDRVTSAALTQYSFDGGMAGATISGSPDGLSFVEEWVPPVFLRFNGGIDSSAPGGALPPFDIFDSQLNQVGPPNEVVKITMRVVGVCEQYDPQGSLESKTSEVGDIITTYENRGTVFLFLWSGWTLPRQEDLFTTHPEDDGVVTGFTSEWDANPATRLILNRGSGSGLVRIDKTVSVTMLGPTTGTTLGGHIFLAFRSGNRIVRQEENGNIVTFNRSAATRANVNAYNATNPLVSGQLLIRPGSGGNVSDRQWIWGKITGIQRNYSAMEQPVYVDNVAPLPV